MILRGANQDMERLPSVSELVPSDLLKNSIATPSQPSQPSPSQASSQAPEPLDAIGWGSDALLGSALASQVPMRFKTTLCVSGERKSSPDEGSEANCQRGCEALQLPGPAKTAQTAFSQARRSKRPRKAVTYAAISWSDPDAVTVRRKGKVGRPIEYTGDPEAIHLTPEQRRKLKRRIANRESARRVRQKKLLSLDELQSKLEESRNRQDRMRQHVCEVQQSNDDLQAKLQVMQRRLQEATAECQLLHQRVAELHSHSCAEECIWSGNLSSGCTRMSVPDPCPVVFECMQQEASNIVQSDGVVLPDWLP